MFSEGRNLALVPVKRGTFLSAIPFTFLARYGECPARISEVILRMAFPAMFSAFLLCSACGAEAEGVWKAPVDAAQRPAPFAASPKVLAAGRTLYLDRCADCHGKNGKGHGPGAADLEKAPTNFTEHKHLQQTDGELYWKITEGRRPMPSYRKKLSDEERWQLVFFIRTFADKP
jgi:mono/diheme cytochrome c family protein